MNAKEMFEKLGYKCVLEIIQQNIDNVKIVYEWSNDKYAKRRISFYENVFYADLYQYDFEKEKLVVVSGCCINVDELKAINQQCSELGWLDE